MWVDKVHCLCDELSAYYCVDSDSWGTVNCSSGHTAV